MKTRIVSGLVGTVILFAVLLCPVSWLLALVLAAAAAIAVYELLHNTGRVPDKVLVYGSMLFAALEVLAVFHSRELLLHNYMESPMVALWLSFSGLLPLLLPVAYALFLMMALLAGHQTMDIAVGGYTFFMTAYATVGFSALAALRVLNAAGLYYVLLPMVISWMSDTGAYFVGTFFGKHKMTPVISPKKSWEGFFGGWIISVGLTAVYAVICNALLAPQAAVSILQFTIMAAVLAPLSVGGDLFASVIKRQSGIKDYGNLMPGHGGVMDRFDSVVFIAPLVYIFCTIV